MRIALGSDHRGAQIAYAIANALLRNAKSDSKEKNAQKLPGAHLIVNATISDSFAQSDDAKKKDDQAVQSPPPAIRPIFYRCTTQNEASDVGENASTSIDYPDVAAAVAQAVSRGEADRGILICGTGIGMSIAANKFRGVRAAVCYNEIAAELSRRHNDANVLCLSGEFLGEQAIVSLLRVWFNTPYDGGRHARRVAKISEIERETGL